MLVYFHFSSRAPRYFAMKFFIVPVFSGPSRFARAIITTISMKVSRNFETGKYARCFFDFARYFRSDDCNGANERKRNERERYYLQNRNVFCHEYKERTPLTDNRNASVTRQIDCRRVCQPIASPLTRARFSSINSAGSGRVTNRMQRIFNSRRKLRLPRRKYLAVRRVTK